MASSTAEHVSTQRLRDDSRPRRDGRSTRFRGRDGVDPLPRGQAA